MNRIKQYAFLFVFAISSLFVVKGIYGYLTDETEPKANALSIEKNTGYTVVHELMNTDGTTYTEHSRTHYAEIPLGQEITPAVLTLEGFTSPATQTVTLNSFNDTVITYRYTRNQYTLTINNSTHVTTSSPSGTYYYGQEIHLVADEENGNGAPFVRWSNNETNRDYTFTLTGNTTIGPIYADSYTITYVPNNEDDPFTEEIIQHEPITTFPDVEYNDCSSSTGSFQERGCTYFYQFLGWYKESTFVNQVDETFVPTADTTLYAKWNKIYYSYQGQYEFTGNDFIDTEVQLFSRENARKDFIVTFTVDEYTGFNDTNNVDHRGTIFSNMNEAGNPYYGVHFYHDTAYVVNINASSNQADRMKKSNTGYVTGQKVVFKRENGIVYYSYDDGPFVQTKNFSSFTAYFDASATFGGGFKPNDPRYLIGKLSDMSVEIIEPLSYTIHFDPNGGTGVMPDQVVELGDNTNLRPNNFVNDDATFAGWNTAADGSGTSYANNYTITSDLGNAGDVITLYAQWILAEHYYVHFDANGGTGTMADQRFTIGNPVTPLSANSFTRTSYEFRGWNTQPDKSGTHYDDLQAVFDLSNTDEDVVTLYAEWWKIQYIHTGDAVFDGTSNTFIDTGVNIFDQNVNHNTFDKDFEIRFTFKSVDSDMFSISPTQPTMFNAKDESNNKYPGMNIRFNAAVNKMSPTYRWGGSTVNIPNNGIASNLAPIEFIYRRTNGVVTMKYKYNGFDSGELNLFNQSSWTLNQAFATNVAFGGYFDGNNQPGRFFKGVLADMIILMEE